MISVDTSVVVRYLVGAPRAQAQRAATLIDGDQEIGLPVVVLLETAHVLRTQYDVPRADVLDTMIELVTREDVHVLGLGRQSVIEALVRARSMAGAPLPDALVAATARESGALPLYSFDRGLSAHGIEVIEP